MKVKVAQLYPTLCDPWTMVHRILQARILEWVAFPFSMGSSQPRNQTQVSHTAHGLFTSWAKGKPKNTGLSNLSHLQGIFQTQELSQGLLHCRRILYQLTYLGSLIPNRERSMPRLYIITLLIQLICRVHEAKFQARWSTSWNQDCWGKYQ